MCSSSRIPRSAAACVLLAAMACGGEQRTELRASAATIQPAFGYALCTTHVVVRGSMPVKPEVSLSGSDSTVEASYRAWVGETELLEVRWIDAETLEATVPQLAPGAWPLTIQSPFGDRSVIQNAFQVLPGSCSQGASLAITATAEPATVQPGGTVTVTATVTNGGNSTATGVSTAVVPPAGFQLSAAPSADQDVTAGRSAAFTWTYQAVEGASRGTFAVTAAGVDASTGQPVTAPETRSNEIAVAYTVGGTVSGLAGTIVLQLNGANDLSIRANGPFSFSAAPVSSGGTYSVSIVSQPSGQTCRLSGQTNTVTTATVSSVVVNCDLNAMSLSIADAGTGAGSHLCNNAQCAPTYPFGTVVAVTASPATGSNFAGWSGACTGTGACVLTMNGDKAVTATFTRATNTLTVTKSGSGTGTVSAPGNLNCGTTCSATYDYGAQVTLTAVAATGSTFTGWSGGGCTGTSATCVVTVTAATTVDAVFTTITGTLTITKFGTGTGTVTGSPGAINCGTACSAAIAFGTQVTLSALADAGSTFTGWTGSGCSGTGTCTVTMTSGVTVVATFTRNPSTLTVTKTGAGTGTVTSSPGAIDCGMTCSALFDFGAQVALTAAADPGSIFTGWTGGGCSGTGQCVVTVNTATTVEATFAVQTFTVRGTVSGLSPTGNSRVTLQLNGANDLNARVGTFAFTSVPLHDGETYTVTVAAAPAGYGCLVARGTGTIQLADVTDVAVDCVAVP